MKKHLNWHVQLRIILIKHKLSYYFEKMDFRKRSFYYNAYSSYVFNESLSNLVKEYSQNVLNEEENISFYFPINENGILNIWAHKKMLPIKRYYYDESNNLTEQRSSRFCISNSVVKIIQVQEDEIYDKWSTISNSCCHREIMPTVAIMQLENIMSNLLEKVMKNLLISDFDGEHYIIIILIFIKKIYYL